MHEAAKRHFDNLGYGKDNKLPSIDTLKQEWATLQSEKKNLYRDYHERKEHRNKLLMAKDNTERILGINRDAPDRAAERRQKSYER